MPPVAFSPRLEPAASGKAGRPFLVVLTGNPNCGKTTLFNALTGLRAKVGNYAGVTVERKEGPLLGAPPDRPVTVLDLPGTYSLSPQSLDEQIVRDVLLGRLPEVRPPDLVVVVVDASNLERNLYYATQVLELGYPTLIALNMVDVAWRWTRPAWPATWARRCCRWWPAPARACPPSRRPSSNTPPAARPPAPPPRRS
jgi:ferrous iron transport protein B